MNKNLDDVQGMAKINRMVAGEYKQRDYNKSSKSTF